jgi:hypothetical protein
MSGARFLDDLARVLAQPMPRRRALRIVGTSLAAAALPGFRPGVAGAAVRAGECRGDTRACPRMVQGAQGPDLCCGSPARRYSCEGTIFEPICVDSCQPGEEPCTSKLKDQNGYAEFACCKPPLRCIEGVCDKPCPPGQKRCGGNCCKSSETCQKGTCCPNTRVCGAACCSPGTKCTFLEQFRTCCPSTRVVSRTLSGKKTRFCCPRGTVAVAGACCPPGDRGCCDELAPLLPDGGDDDLAPLDPYVGRTFCVKGKRKRL